MRLKPEDLLHLRKLHWALQGVGVALAQAQQDWDEAVLALEEAYGVVGQQMRLDRATGELTIEGEGQRP